MSLAAMGDEGLDSLARAIEEVGLLQPVATRPLGTGRYERRVAASGAGGRDENI